LTGLLEAHRASGREVTLLLRSSGPALHVDWDSEIGLVRDIRGLLGVSPAGRQLQFTGIYAVEPAFVRRFVPDVPAPVIPAFLELIREGRLGGWVDDRGFWRDLGDPASYLEVHLEPPAIGFPAYAPAITRVRHHPESVIAADAFVDPKTWVGPGAVIESGARLERCVVWPGALVPPGGVICREVVRGTPESFLSRCRFD
jgi:NDP-sugar pyrophosphorylase family protein